MAKVSICVPTYNNASEVERLLQSVHRQNYTDYEVPYTRIIEHKHFEFGTQPKTVITREYPAAWEKGKEPYYPVNDPKNSELFDKYERRALEEKNVIFGGRLGMYRYMDMDQVIEEALSLAETELTYEEP